MDRIVVIGGGIVGASAAYHLACAGVDTVLIDAADDGAATSAGAGIVAPALSKMPSRPWFDLAFAAAAAYPSLIDRLAEDGEETTGYREIDGLLIAMDAEEAARLDDIRAMVDVRVGAGMAGTVTRVSEAETRRLFPPIADGAVGLHVAGMARVDGRLLRDALTRAAVRRGATPVRGRAGLDADEGVVRAVTVGDERIGCDAVLVAAGAWSARVPGAAAESIAVGPQRGQIAHFALSGQDTSDWPFVVGFHSHYLLPFGGPRVVAGATREDGVGFDHRVTAEGIAEVVGEALRVAPGLGDAALAEIRVGFRPVTPDGLPLLGRVDGLATAFVATGMGPTGLTLGPYGGALVAGLAVGDAPTTDLTAFAPTRFAEAAR